MEALRRGWMRRAESKAWRVCSTQGFERGWIATGASEKRWSRSSSAVVIKAYLRRISYNLPGIDFGVRCRQSLMIRIV